VLQTFSQLCYMTTCE